MDPILSDSEDEGLDTRGVPASSMVSRAVVEPALALSLSEPEDEGAQPAAAIRQPDVSTTRSSVGIKVEIKKIEPLDVVAGASF
jgi:hypothetical protein